MANSAISKNQREVSGNIASTTVPKIRIYIERPEESADWFVNVRHVSYKGSWRAEPHAHPQHGQVIFVRSGRGVMNLEGRSVPFEGPCALVLPTECVHGLDYEIDVDRWLMTIELAYLTQVNAKLQEFVQLWSAPRIIPLSHTVEAEVEFDSLLRRVDQEVKSTEVGHIEGTEALLTILFLMLVRGMPLDQIGNEGATRNDTRLAERFRDLVEQHYRDNVPLQEYASLLAVSLVQLRAACASATGQSPTKMIHARLVTEAKRNLIFGDMSVEQIAFGLGFSDAAYFTRFFRKEVGQTPSQFRAAAR